MQSTKAMKVKYTPIAQFLKSTTLCSNGRFCKVENCPYLHNVKTRMCKFGPNCRRIEKCSFAHKESEIYVPECRFGSNCKKEDCTYKHPVPFNVPSEDKENIPVPTFKLNKCLFPTVKKTDDQNVPTKPTNVLDYSDIKVIIPEVDSITLSGEDILEQYTLVKKYNKMTIVL